MHLADRMTLPTPYVARPFRGAPDHATIADVLNAYRAHIGDQERTNAEQIAVSYEHLDDCDPDRDVFVVELADGTPVGYGRASVEDLGDGTRDCIVFNPTRPEHLHRPLFDAIVAAQEEHMAPWAADAPSARYRAYAAHPGPGEEPVDEAAWLEARGYAATEWGASLLRPHLDDIPDLPLPDGVEVRPVRPEDIRTILAAHFEAFRGEWDFHEPTESDVAEFVESPFRDESLWQVAWAGDTVVGQVKPFINHEENAERGYLRGYTEDISTHHDWRNRGIAAALLARALQTVKDRGMTEAELGVDTNNPGGAFHLYTKLGFELRAYEAVYTKPAP